MRRPEHRQRNPMRGFTSVELMVAMAVTSIIAGFLYSVYFFSMKLSKSWREKMAGEDTAVICMHRLTEDLIRAHRIDRFDDAKWILYLDDDKRILYERQDNNLFRDGYRLYNSSIGIYGLILETSINNSSNGENKDNSEVPMVEVEMLVGDAKRRFTLRAVVYPRNGDKAVFQTL